MSTLRFLRENARWLAAGFLMTLASSFGQTFFIAIFSEPLRVAFELSHGAFGAIYMIGTLASALVLTQAGQLADHWPTRPLAMAILAGLAAVCLAMALVPVWWLLPVVIFGLRLFGQGLISHLGVTCTARWFVASRGRALGITGLGYPTGEALAPVIAVALILALGWRAAWALAAVTVLLILAPALWLLLARDRAPTGVAAAADAAATGIGGRHWTRAEVLRARVFWLLLPGFLAPSFIVTVFFFLPAHIAETKGWAFESLPQTYWVYALAAVLSSLAYGWIIDRASARACLCFYQLPMAAALALLWIADGPEDIAPILILVGFTAGAAVTVAPALWAELFGTRHIGGVKALTFGFMVAATAAGPGLAGVLIDLGAPFPEQGLWMAGYILCVSALFLGLYLSGELGTRSISASA